MISDESCRSGRNGRWTAFVLCLAGCAWFALASARAQSERHGVRVHYASIASAGGLEGRAFLPVAAQGVVVAPHRSPSCAGAPTLTVRAAVSRGPLRAIVLSLPKQLGRAPLGGGGCGSAELDLTWEDQTVLRGGQGYVELNHEPTNDDPTFRGAFAQTASYRGATMTIEGTFSASSPSAAPNR